MKPRVGGWLQCHGKAKACHHEKHVGAWGKTRMTEMVFVTALTYDLCVL